MEVKAARKVSIYDRLEGKPVRNEVCSYWLAGRCNRNPCRFIHKDKSPSPPHGANRQKQSRKMAWMKPSYSSPMTGDEERWSRSTKSIWHMELTTDGRKHSHMDQEIAHTALGKDSRTLAQPHVSAAERTETDKGSVQATQPKQCKYWITGNCVHGDNCNDLHSWFYGSGFTMLTKLEGHSKVPTVYICL